MARPTKQGLDYFSFDVDAPEDDKFQAVEVDHGPAGCWIILRLFCSLYRVGYCYRWSERDRKLFARRSHISIEELDSIIETALEVGLFSRSVLESTGFLTSKAIQKRWLAASRKRTGFSFLADVWLLEEFPEGFRVGNSEETPEQEGFPLRKLSGNDQNGGVSVEFTGKPKPKPKPKPKLYERSRARDPLAIDLEKLKLTETELGKVSNHTDLDTASAREACVACECTMRQRDEEPPSGSKAVARVENWLRTFHRNNGKAFRLFCIERKASGLGVGMGRGEISSPRGAQSVSALTRDHAQKITEKWAEMGLTYENFWGNDENEDSKTTV